MKVRSLTLSSVSRVLLCLVLPMAAGSAAFGDANELVRNSPFLPEGYQPPQDRRPTPPPQRPPPPSGPEPLDRIEFRGMANFGGRTEFSLFDPSQKRSFWIGLNRTEGGFTVAEYKDKEDAIVVRHEGKTRTISLHESKIAALAPEATPAPARPREPGARPTPAAQPEDPEERMRNLADEIRRRREVRRALVEESEGNQP